MSIDLQKSVAQQVMDNLSIVDPFCILAGGAPRDWYFGREATDLDFFIHLGRVGRKDTVTKQLGKLFDVECVKSGEKMPENYKLNPYLRHVFQIGGYDVPVQIMVMSEPIFISVVDLFPLSICKAWWKDGVLQTHGDFQTGLRHNAIFKTATEYGEDHKYIQKICDKYPDMRYYDSELQMYRVRDFYSDISIK